MKGWRWALLIFELALFAVILILPQVALPDVTFHGGTAPILMRNRVSSMPLLLAIFLAVQVALGALALRESADAQAKPLCPSSHSRLLLLCTLLC